MIGKSRMTVQAIELGKLDLSEGLAIAISKATGVSAEWLLHGDPSEPPVDANGKPWTRDFYDLYVTAADMHRKIKKHGGSKADAERMARGLFGDDVAADLMKALRGLLSDPDRHALAVAKARRLIAELEKSP